MFSQGQLIFAGIFATVFIAVIIYSYIKDRKIHTKFYKNSYLILLTFLLFIGLLLVIKTYLKKKETDCIYFFYYTSYVLFSKTAFYLTNL